MRTSMTYLLAVPARGWCTVAPVSMQCIPHTGEGPLAFCSGGDQEVRGKGGYVGADGVPRLNVLDLQARILLLLAGHPHHALRAVASAYGAQLGTHAATHEPDAGLAGGRHEP